MSMTCLHKGHTMREEIEISVVLLDESFLHHAFLFVGRKLCSLIFRCNHCCRAKQKPNKGPSRSSAQSVTHNWGRMGKHVNWRMMNWKMRMMVTSSRLRSSKVITIRPSLLLMKELEFSTKRKTQLRTNGQRHELSHENWKREWWLRSWKVFYDATVAERNLVRWNLET